MAVFVVTKKTLEIRRGVAGAKSSGYLRLTRPNDEWSKTVETRTEGGKFQSMLAIGLKNFEVRRDDKPSPQVEESKLSVIRTKSGSAGKAALR